MCRRVCYHRLPSRSSEKIFFHRTRGLEKSPKQRAHHLFTKKSRKHLALSSYRASPRTQKNHKEPRHEVSLFDRITHFRSCSFSFAVGVKPRQHLFSLVGLFYIKSYVMRVYVRTGEYACQSFSHPGFQKKEPSPPWLDFPIWFHFRDADSLWMRQFHESSLERRSRETWSLYNSFLYNSQRSPVSKCDVETNYRRGSRMVFFSDECNKPPQGLRFCNAPCDTFAQDCTL